MIPGIGDLPAWTLAWTAGVMLLSGFVRGVIGTLPWAAAACATLALGHRPHERASIETCGRWLRGFLWVMAAVLAVQFARAMWARLG